jgi:hypothetical protein
MSLAKLIGQLGLQSEHVAPGLVLLQTTPSLAFQPLLLCMMQPIEFPSALELIEAEVDKRKAQELYMFVCDVGSAGQWPQVQGYLYCHKSLGELGDAFENKPARLGQCAQCKQVCIALANDDPVCAQCTSLKRG